MAEIDRRKAALIAELEISRGEIRSATRAAIACAAARDSAALQRVALDVPAGVDLDRVLQK